jgi:regulator of replication initiation timing
VAPGDEQRIEELESEVAAVRRDLWSVRDALIGAQAESATLKVRNRELEVRLAQFTQLLNDQSSFDRLVGRLRANAALRAAGRRVKLLAKRAG